MGLSRTVFEVKGNNICKIPLVRIMLLLRGYPWNFVTAVGLRKLERRPYQIRQKSAMVCAFISNAFISNAHTIALFSFKNKYRHWTD